MIRTIRKIRCERKDKGSKNRAYHDITPSLNNGFQTFKSENLLHHNQRVIRSKPSRSVEMRRRKHMVEHVLCNFGGNCISNFVHSVDWIGELGFLQSFVELLVSNAAVFLDFSDFECLSN